MNRKWTAAIATTATVVLGAVIWLISLIEPTARATFPNSAAALTFITAAAVGIERAIEAAWTLVGSLSGSYWPLNVMSRQVDGMVKDLDCAVQPIYEKAQQALREIEGEETWAQGAIAEIEQFKRRFNELRDLVRAAPDNQRVQLLAAAASQNVNYLEQRYRAYLPDRLQALATAGGQAAAGEAKRLMAIAQAYAPDFDRAKGTAKEAINGLQDFVASFKDNPGRRLISLYAGALLGLGLAGIFGLDLFQAALQLPQANVAHPQLDIILTGVIIGLGSNPTHEVIRAIQEYKKNVKGGNISTPDEPSQA
ncbi:MAG: hypothetical protein M3319_08930 [Actinomycetota bacterium]|nr:hypothetical protein [Actinomycetota bacterium]